jgi:hypothetical protein
VQPYPPKQFDVIRVANLTVMPVQNQKVVILRESIEVVTADITCAIGNPQDIAENLKQRSLINFDQQFEIPIKAMSSDPSSKMSIE